MPLLTGEDPFVGEKALPCRLPQASSDIADATPMAVLTGHLVAGKPSLFGTPRRLWCPKQTFSRPRFVRVEATDDAASNTPRGQPAAGRGEER
jgi:hypothetical protein